MASVIRLDGVSITKQGRAVLADLTMDLEAGAIYAVFGPSGAGKSTLLRLLNRLEDPTAGTLWFRGTPYPRFSPLELRQRIAMVFQVPVVFAGTVGENLVAPLRLHRREMTFSEVPRILALAGLDASFIDRSSERLSVGEKQRVCIARALMLQPEVLLLDEPTAALDPTAAQQLIASIAELNRCTGLTVVIVTHQPQQARMLNGEILLLVGGRLVEHGSAARFFATPSTSTGRAYLTNSLSGTHS